MSKDYSSMSSTQLVEIYNMHVPEEKQIKKFRDHATAVARVTEITKQKEKHMSSKTSEAKTTLIETPAKKKQSARKVDSSKKISILVEFNPRRPATKGWTNFGLYKEGMTISEFRAAGGGSNHLNWDIKHGYISVE